LDCSFIEYTYRRGHYVISSLFVRSCAYWRGRPGNWR
jgi:hypothetical protein